MVLYSVESGQVQISSGDHFFNQDPGDGIIQFIILLGFLWLMINGNEVASIPELETEYFINYQYHSALVSLKIYLNKLKYLKLTK